MTERLSDAELMSDREVSELIDAVENDWERPKSLMLTALAELERLRAELRRLRAPGDVGELVEEMRRWEPYPRDGSNPLTRAADALCAQAAEIERLKQALVETSGKAMDEIRGAVSARVVELDAAIRKHRAQQAVDRCWLDDQELYKALGDGDTGDNSVGDPVAMLENCKRFIERRCQGGKWPNYADLERRLAAAEKMAEAIQDLELWENALDVEQGNPAPGDDCGTIEEGIAETRQKIGDALAAYREAKETPDG